MDYIQINKVLGENKNIKIMVFNLKLNIERKYKYGLYSN